jgi:hypothetical protein
MAFDHEDHRLVRVYMAKKLGRLYDGQICLVAGERADHGNAFSSSPPLLHLLFLDFFFFSQTKNGFFIL